MDSTTSNNEIIEQLRSMATDNDIDAYMTPIVEAFSSSN